MGLAEFEILSALFKTSIRKNLVNASIYSDFENHWISETMQTNGLEGEFAKLNQFVRDNTLRRVHEEKSVKKGHSKISRGFHVVKIGAVHDEQRGNRSSAQRASYAAHMAAYELGLGGENLEMNNRISKRINDYSSRGEMIFVGKLNSLIWIGNHNWMGLAQISGLAGSMIRLWFYRAEFYFYYKVSGCPLILCKIYHKLRMALANQGKRV